MCKSRVYVCMWYNVSCTGNHFFDFFRACVRWEDQVQEAGEEKRGRNRTEHLNKEKEGAERGSKEGGERKERQKGEEKDREGCQELDAVVF